MQSKVDATFRAQAKRYALRFCCEDCAHFELERERCAHEYPTEDHRRRDLEKSEVVVFCKEFELA
ncbi:MAG TPA: hypothetical protein PKA88_12235 [Polyangiaceae bacterium]|nr:hypothetical protein [Polyangiaceae bacterium]